MTAAGKFSIATGDSAFPHLVLKGANGEPVVWSEVYTAEKGAHEALEVIVRTVLTATNSVLYDLALADGEVESHEEAVVAALDVPDLVERVTKHLLDT